MAANLQWTALGLDLDDELKNGKDMVSHRINGKHIVLAHHQGAWHAFPKNCPHAGGDLYTGWVNDEGCIVCPVHKFAFRLTDGENTTGEGYKLSVYPVKRERQIWWIAFPRKKWFNWW